MRTLFQTLGSHGQKLSKSMWEDCLWNYVFTTLDRASHMVRCSVCKAIPHALFCCNLKLLFDYRLQHLPKMSGMGKNLVSVVEKQFICSYIIGISIYFF